jgi:phosphoribosylformylglycinamidine synthase
VSVTGATPWALTDCLNFGDAEDPAVMGDLEAAIDGLAAAASALGALAAEGAPLPFVSGNVSLYNHGGGRSIPASPIVMCAGVIDRIERAVPRALARPGDALLLMGEPRDTLTGSIYLVSILEQSPGAPPPLDLEREVRLQRLALRSAAESWASAAHDVSSGGLLATVIEMLLAGAPGRGLGVTLDIRGLGAPDACALWCERPAIVFAASAPGARALLEAARELEIDAWPIGRVTADGRVRVETSAGARGWEVAELRAASASGLERLWNEELDP